MPGVTVSSRLTPLCSRILGLGASSGRRLEGAFKLNVHFGEESFVHNIEVIKKLEHDMMDDIHQIDAKEDDIMKKELEILDTLDVLMGLVKDMMLKLDMDVSQPKNGLRSKKHKKAKAEIFHRNLGNSEGSDLKEKLESVMKGKFDKMENQIKLVESKVESLETKVDNMDKSIVEIKEMLSQLMMREAADA